MAIQDAITDVNQFKTGSLAKRIAHIESALSGKPATQVDGANSRYGVNRQLILSILAVKQASAQIDVVLHAAGILYSLPHLLAPDEIIESLALGADNACTCAALRCKRLRLCRCRDRSGSTARPAPVSIRWNWLSSCDARYLNPLLNLR